MRKAIATAILLFLLASPALAAPVAYGTMGEMERYEQQEQQKEDGETADEAKEEIQESDEKTSTTYSKTTVTEKVSYYRDGKIVKQRSLKKQVRGKRENRDGIDGWHVVVKEEYVKYWHTTERQKTPVIGVKTGEKFYPDENGQPVDLESL